MRSHPKIAIWYSLAAAIFGAVVPFSGRWVLIPLWLASLMAIFAAAYWFGIENPYHKKRGIIRWTVRISAAPHVAGTWIVRRWTASRMRSMADEIVPQLWLGRLLNQDEALTVVAELGLTAVVDLSAEHSESPALRGLAYFNLPVLDMTAPSARQLETASRFIADHIHRGAVYVHCGHGLARSATVVAAYLMFSAHAVNVDEACKQVSAKRPEVRWKPHLVESLRRFEGGLSESQTRAVSSPQGQPSRSA